MPVAATIIADANVAAFITGIHMATQCGGAALGYCPKGLLLMNA